MATTPWDDSPPTIDERYDSASNTADLTMGGGMIPKDHRGGAGEVIGAAGYAAGVDQHGPSPARLGMALLRLHSEWTACARPKRVGREAIEAIAASIRAQDVTDKATAEREAAYRERLQAMEYRTEAQDADLTRLTAKGAYVTPKPAISRANDEASRWYTNELRLLALRLKTRGEVVRQLIGWAAIKGIPPGTATDALAFWLDDNCHHCHGHGLRHIDWQASKICKDCSGTGKQDRTDGMNRVLKQIDYALGMARNSLRERLRK